MTQSGHVDTKCAASAHGWLRSPGPWDKDEHTNPHTCHEDREHERVTCCARPEATRRQLLFLKISISGTFVQVLNAAVGLGPGGQ